MRVLLYTGVGFLLFVVIVSVAVATKLRQTTKRLENPALVVTTSPPRHTYPGEVTSRFVRGCVVRGASRASCVCVVKGLEDAMPLEDFQRLDRLIRDGRPIPPKPRAKLRAILMRCRGTS